MKSVQNVKITDTSKNINSFAIQKKIVDLQEIVKRTIIATQKYKVMDVFGANELNICIQNLQKIFKKLQKLHAIVNESEQLDNNIIENIQHITKELSGVFKTFGTDNIDDLVNVCISSDFWKNFSNQNTIDKYNVMKKYVHPIGYKVMYWKNIDRKDIPNADTKKTRLVEDYMIMENSDTLDCYDLARTSKSFQTKVYGIKISIQNPIQNNTLLVCGIVDDIMIDCLNYKYIESRITNLTENRPAEQNFRCDAFTCFVNCLTLKELLIFNDIELYERYVGYLSQTNLMKQKTISQITKEFIHSDLYAQRTSLIQLLIKSDEHESQYLAYLLYDLLSNDINGNIDTQEQTLLFDSFPWTIKKCFREAMKQTVSYTRTLSNFDNSKIPLEQQICLLKANDSVKDKAMLKLKEVKAKSEDSGTKARQYLEALLRIPFGIYKEEPILSAMKDCTSAFNEIMIKIDESQFTFDKVPFQNSYNSLEMRNYCKILNETFEQDIKIDIFNNLQHKINNFPRKDLISIIIFINDVIKTRNISKTRICHSGKNIIFMRNKIDDFINYVSNDYDILISIFNHVKSHSKNDIVRTVNEGIINIREKEHMITQFMSNLTNTLDQAVHGHNKAKRQVERIIGQWINGEKSGYCFGFEGPPGVGKTSLAKKGIAQCLKDDANESRPFAFIAIGGSSNGSTLDGHNYTYVGSTWGRIVDILMETKCMNPIIFIDELDKVSKTEQGKEIIGILTHLIDQTQNDCFHDKYFNGIDLDLSKALFIFSYNDVDAIDRILLDRIHRIKFSHLSIEDKLVITNTHLLPEIYRNMGLEGIVTINNETIKFIINEYTSEPGVRKLKEILFEIFGEINLSILKNGNEFTLPLNLSITDIKYKYLKDREEVKNFKIQKHSCHGVICGLWANSLGMGGVLPIETKFFPSSNFLDLNLTGMQGNVMKESMNVAKTLAWNLMSDEQKVYMHTEFKSRGVHIHVPEGATPKDGPSAGTAITIAMYSLFTKKIIPYDIALTGEICLQGRVTAIGGLELKLLGGIKSGVKTFIFPEENEKEFTKFIENPVHKSLITGITFIKAKTIEDVISAIF